MAAGRMVRSAKLAVTNQSLADLALFADQERRAALKRGDKKLAKELDKEVEALAASII